MIRRQITLQPVSLLAFATLLLLLLAAITVERQLAQGLQAVHTNAPVTAPAAVAAPAEAPAHLGGSVTREIKAAPGRAPLVSAAAAPTSSGQQPEPAVASPCPNKPGSDLVCSAP
jgi:hypothetical protein